MDEDYGTGPATLMLRKCVEPQKRNKDGLRWIVHRYAIRGGISQMEALRRDMIEYACRPNPLLELFPTSG